MFYVYLRRGKYGHIRVPTTQVFASLPKAGKCLRHAQFLCRLLAILLLVLAASRPQQPLGMKIQKGEGLEIILTVDTSGSMRALDFVDAAGERKNRLHVVKEVLRAFIDARERDRIGMVVFGGEAYLQSPLTLDHGVLREFLRQISIGMAGENTAIGDAIGVSIKRLQSVNAKSKLIILLTDGENNAGSIKPLVATQMAKKADIKVYTVGIGSDREVPVKHRGRYFYQHFPLDEKLLQEIAKETGGRYFKAQDREALRGVYAEIDALEKTEHEDRVYYEYREMYVYPLWLAVFFFLLENLLSLTRWRRLP